MALRATGYSVINTTYHAPRTTNHGADTRVRPYDEMTRTTSHELRATTTGHKLQAAYRCFFIPPKRAFGSREPVQTGAVIVGSGCHRKS